MCRQHWFIPWIRSLFNAGMIHRSGLSGSKKKKKTRTILKMSHCPKRISERLSETLENYYSIPLTKKSLEAKYREMRRLHGTVVPVKMSHCCVTGWEKWFPLSWIRLWQQCCNHTDIPFWNFDHYIVIISGIQWLYFLVFAQYIDNIQINKIFLSQQ